MLHAANAREDPRLRNLASRKVCANIVLQMSLYYGTIYSVAWIIFWLLWISFRYPWNSIMIHDEDIVRTVFMALWVFFEPIRLCAGWYGNLQENVPWLILFLIISFAPLQVIVFYIMLNGADMNSSHPLGPIAKSVQIVQAGILELQFLSGLYTVFRMYAIQKRQFYLFEYVMNARRRKDEDSLLEGTNRGHSQGSGGSGGIGRGGQRRPY